MLFDVAFETFSVPSIISLQVIYRCVKGHEIKLFTVTSRGIRICYLTKMLSKAKAQMARGQGNKWLIDSPKCFHLCVTRPPEICVNLVFKHIHAATIYTMH